MNNRKNKYIVIAMLFCCFSIFAVFALNALAVNGQTGSVSADELKNIQNGNMIAISWEANSEGSDHVAEDKKLVKTSVITDDDGSPWLQITIYPSKNKVGCSGAYEGVQTTATFTISAQSGYENLYVKWDGDAKGEWTSDSTSNGTFTLNSEEGSIEPVVKKVKLVITQVEFPTIYFRPANQERCSATVTIGTESIAVGSDYSGNHVFETASIKTASASPAEGYVFDGWSVRNEAGTVRYLGGASINGQDIEIPLGTWYLAPVFRPASNTTEPFKVVTSDTEELYHYLDVALCRAAEISGKVIVISDTDVVLANGKECIVPYGTTLLIPYSETDTGALNASYENCAVSTTTAGTRTSEYRTLNLPTGYTLSVDGTVLINAIQGYLSNNTMGCISGKHGLLTADGDITVNDGGKLYAYGLITGYGKLTANVGSNIYQFAEITDMRGGSAMLANYLKFFPINQLYLQNIQIETTYISGCRMYGSGYVHTSLGAMSSLVLLIGADSETTALFSVENGNLCFSYDSSLAKTIVDINGSVRVQAVKLTVDVGLNIPISSENYECPLTAAFDVNINENGTFNVTNKFKILPGCVITIEDKGTLTIQNGSSLYLYDADDAHFPRESEAAYVYRRWPSTSANKSGVMPAETKDGSLVVNGILNVFGNLYTSSTSDYSGIGHSIKTTSSTGVINYAATSKNTTSFDSPFSTSSVNHYFTKPYGYITNGVSCEWRQFSKGTYLSNGSAWYCESHTLIVDEAVDATCTETGLTEGKHCSVCGEIVVAQEVIPAGHSYEAVVTAPTCTEDGYTTYTCVTCGDNYVADEVSALGHDYDAVVTAPTCTDAGYTTYTCACGDSYVANEVASLGHDYNAVVTAPTCTEDGYTTYTCVTCGDSYTEEISATGHDDGEWANPENGYQNLVCTVCGEVLDTKLAPTLTLEYRLNDYIWMNAIIEVADCGDKLITLSDESIEVVPVGNGKFYLVRKVLSNELTDTFKATVYFDGASIAEIDLSFTTFANELIDKEDKHAPLVQAMLNYGKAADDYFDGTQNYTELALFKNAPVNNLKGQYAATNDYNGVQLKTVGATVDFANCIGLVLRFKMNGALEHQNGVLANGDKIVQIGFMVGDGSGALTAESYDRAYIYYGETSDSDNGSDNAIGDISGSVSGLQAKCPEDLTQEMRLRFDLTNEEYREQFALRPFLVIGHADGTYTNLYGEQYLYGFEDYCARTYANTGYGIKEKNLAVYAWEYAVAASEAEFTEGE